MDFLFLDVSVCTRCQGADTSLDEALSEVSKVLEATSTHGSTMSMAFENINFLTNKLRKEYYIHILICA
ncbi:DUF2703 domain-containing protein [Desulfosporosinus burensis]